MMKTMFLFLAFFACTITAPAQNKASMTATSQTQTPEIFRIVEEMPEFPGGITEQMNYISKNIHYPPISSDRGYAGTSYIRFIVDTAGYIKEPTVIKSIPNCAECDKEALRLVNAMPRWKPGKQNGRVVNVYYDLPVRFKLQ